MVDVEWTRSGLETLETLDPEVQERVLDKLAEASEWPEHFLEPLTGYPYYTLRVGDYRVIIEWDRDEETLLAGAVGHRRNVYDRPPAAVNHRQYGDTPGPSVHAGCFEAVSSTSILIVS